VSDRLARRAIADLVLENAALRETLAIYQSVLAQSGGLLYENLTANAGLAPDDRRIGEDVVEQVLARAYLRDQGGGDGCSPNAMQLRARTAGAGPPLPDPTPRRLRCASEPAGAR
jgi:hypothetical protein